MKRSGHVENLDVSKLRERIKRSAEGIGKDIDIDTIVKHVESVMPEEVQSATIDDQIAITALNLSTHDVRFARVAANVYISTLHKTTSDLFLETVRRLYNYEHPVLKRPSPLVSKTLLEMAMKYEDQIRQRIDYARDYNLSYFGLCTLARSYLIRLYKTKEIVERPQHMWMRVALSVYCNDDIDAALEMYDDLSQGYYVHATPTLSNAGTPCGQLASCFLLNMEDDSIEGIFRTLSRAGKVSKAMGGLGICMTDIRAQGSFIAGTNGTSNGLPGLLPVFNAAMRYVDQGGGKRHGKMACYLSLIHKDIPEVLEMRKNTGSAEIRARDSFFGLWIPALFAERLKRNEHWTMFCPTQCPDLVQTSLTGDEWKNLYEHYENTVPADQKRVMPATELWARICDAELDETSGYYMHNADMVNACSNYKHWAPVKGANLCAEIVQPCRQFKTREEYEQAKRDFPAAFYATREEEAQMEFPYHEDATCNLASICVKKFVDKENKTINRKLLGEKVRKVVRNLNRVIDVTTYPTREARDANWRHRPMGIGVQGLQDLFFELGMAFDSEEARVVNRDVFECIYYNAVFESMILAQIHGPYSTFKGSPASQGFLQPHLNAQYTGRPVWYSGVYDFDQLAKLVVQHGMRNAVLIAPMPTASTAQIGDNTECFEPIYSNVFTRNVLSGTFTIVNKYLIEALRDEAGIEWTDALREAVIAHEGSIQSIPGIPDNIKARFKTAFEIKQSCIVRLASDRQPFIDQSSSLNIFMANPTTKDFNTFFDVAMRRTTGLKTVLYYLKRRPAAKPQNVVSLPTAQLQLQLQLPQEATDHARDGPVCTKEEGCLSCGS